MVGRSILGIKLKASLSPANHFPPSLLQLALIVRMASPFLLAQQFFSALSNSGTNHPGCSNATSNNATFNSTYSPSAPFATDATSLISFLVSFSALREWLKLLLFGSLLESLRRLGLGLYYKVYASFFITARFEEEDTSFCKPQASQCSAGSKLICHFFLRLDDALAF